MPVAKGLLQQCHLQCQKGEACETLAARVTEWRESPPGRLPSSRSSWEPVLKDVRPASGLREALESLPAAHFLLCEDAPPQRVERPCLHAATPSGRYSYVLDVWGSLSPSAAASSRAPLRPQSMEAPRTFVPFNDYGKALNRSASPQRYPRPTKPLAAQPRRLSFGAAERAPTATGAPPPESPTMSTERLPWDSRQAPAAADSPPASPTPAPRVASGKGQRVAVRDIGASCHDGRHPATAMFDGQKFWATTGLFPQSALARLPSPTRLSSLSLDVGPSVRQVTVSVGHLDQFEDVATVTFSEGAAHKRVSLENVLARDVRIRIDRASGSFAIVQKVEVVGVPA